MIDDAPQDVAHLPHRAFTLQFVAYFKFNPEPMALCLFKKVQPFDRIHLYEKPGTEPGTTKREEESISPSPSHILMALLRKSIRRVSLNIAGRIRERNKSAGGKGARNNTGVALWWQCGGGEKRVRSDMELWSYKYVSRILRYKLG